MLFPRASDIPFEEKVRAVERYLRTSCSLRAIASSLGISHKILLHWVNLYKQGGKANLLQKKFHKKKLPVEVERKIMFLKEQNPWVSIRKAKQLLEKDGVQISNKGIWSIWKRYGLINRKEQKKTDPLDIFSNLTPELAWGIEKAKMFVEKEDYKRAAKVINNLPSLPEYQLLKKIPEKYLTLRKKLNRLYLEIGDIPYPQFLKKIRHVGKALEKKGYVYSSIIADFLELNALGWIRKPEEKIVVLNRLAKKTHGMKDSSFKFLFYFEQASTYSDLLQISKVSEIIKKCRKLIHLLPYAYYWEHLADLLTFAGKYKDAFPFYKKVFKSEKDESTMSRITLKMAIYGYSYAGKYSDCKKILTKAQALRNSVGFGTTYSLINAYLSFGQGNLADAAQFFLESLEKAYKGLLHNRIYATSLGLASVSMALNKKADAKMYLKKYLPLMRKYTLAPEELILKCLLNSTGNIPEEFLRLPPLCLLHLLIQAKQTMKIGDYRKALDFAQRQGLMGLFHRWIVFFPEPILHLLEKGKKTGLPKTILRFSIFNQKIPVYHIKILGKFIVLKNKQYLSTKLTPKEKAFLIHLALKAEVPEKSILLSDLYQNFWQGSENPSSLLSHTLARIKRKAMIPGHLIGTVTKYAKPVLVNRGLYITTDFNDFKIALTQATALQQAGEWSFARKEYLQAFKLFRGEPFKKMYDNWSEHMRRVILDRLETEALHFAKSCFEHNNKKDARKVLEKVLKIIPQSEESQKLLETLCP